jgi:hypothetical protein
MYYKYQARLPRQPDLAAGQVYPLNVHGIVLYQTLDQRNQLDKLLYSTIASALVSGLMAAIYQKKFKFGAFS